MLQRMTATDGSSERGIWTSATDETRDNTLEIVDLLAELSVYYVFPSRGKGGASTSGM